MKVRPNSALCFQAAVTDLGKFPVGFSSTWLIGKETWRKGTFGNLRNIDEYSRRSRMTYKPSINHDYRDWWTKYSELNKRSSAERIPETSSNQDSPSIIIESVSVLLYYVATPSTRHHICYNICFLSLSLWLTCARANVNIKDLISNHEVVSHFSSNQPPWTYQRNHFLVTLADASTKPSNLGHLKICHHTTNPSMCARWLGPAFRCFKRQARLQSLQSPDYFARLSRISCLENLAK